MQIAFFPIALTDTAELRQLSSSHLLGVIWTVCKLCFVPLSVGFPFANSRFGRRMGAHTVP
jgi:hypothetical protein